MFEPLTLENQGIVSPYTLSPLLHEGASSRQAKAAAEAMDRAIREALDMVAILPPALPGWGWVPRLESDDDVDLDSLRATSATRIVWKLEWIGGSQ